MPKLVPARRPAGPAAAIPLDLARIGSRETAPSRKRGFPTGLIPSLLLHSLPLLALIGWQTTPVDLPKPIPVELVIEPPPPAPAPTKTPAAPQPIRGASADLGDPKAPKIDHPVENADPSPAKSERAAEARTAATTDASPPEPKTAAATSAAPPEPAPSEEPAQPPATELKTAMATPPLPPKPAPHKRPTLPMPVPLASSWPLPLHHDPPHETRRFATLSGPAAVRDEYCVRALNLTLRHLDLLPRAFVGDRRGKTVLTIRILGDGTLNSVKLAQSSGYPDIDGRIQQMVFAVGQYPPLPPRIPGTWMDFTFIMVFPDAAER